MRRPEVALVLVRRGEEFLVLHRAPGGGAYWHPVAGALEEGESYAEAAARELEEETGLAAAPVEIAGAYVYAPGVSVRPFLADAPAGWEPELDREHDGYRWCTRDEALELLHWPEPRAVLRALS